MSVCRNTGPSAPFAVKSNGLDFCRSHGGFTLIETLVAFMVLSIALVVVMQLFSGALKSSAVSTDYMYGIYHAREITEEFLLNPRLAPGTFSGDFEDGYRWEAAVTPVTAENQEKAVPEAVLLDITVTVQWMSGSREKRFIINTNKIAGHADGFIDATTRG